MMGEIFNEDISLKEKAVGQYIKQLGKSITKVVYESRTSPSGEYFISANRNENRIALIREIHDMAMEAIKEIE